MSLRFWRYRLALLVSMALIIPIGYGSRFYLSPELEWLRNWIGNLAYECFWLLFVMFWLPQISPLRAAMAVCLASFAIEFLQLWQPLWLQFLRATLFGRLVLGNSFYWADFPQYIAGSFLGWLWVSLLPGRPLTSQNPSRNW
jgi:Protein of unknown function (DUF2809)